MRIMSPPKFIMNTSLIMRLIITLIVFQCVSDLRALSEKDDVPRRGRVGSPRLLQGSLSDYMPNICASPAGSGSVSPAEALAVACTLTNRR